MVSKSIRQEEIFTLLERRSKPKEPEVTCAFSNPDSSSTKNDDIFTLLERRSKSSEKESTYFYPSPELSNTKHEDIFTLLARNSRPLVKEATLAYPSPPSSPLQRTSTKVDHGEPKCDAEPYTSIPLNTDPLITTEKLDIQSPLPEQEPILQAKHHDGVTNIKTQLGLDDMRCGCKTVKDIPCRMSIPEGRHNKIQVQLASLVTLTRSSPELEVELNKLAKLVQCRHHDSAYLLESRVDRWRTTFPVGEKDTESMPSIEKQIRKLLGPVSLKCPGSSTDGICSYRIGGRRVQNCARTIKEIVKPDVYSNDERLNLYLKVLESNRFCEAHKRETPNRTTSWESAIIEMREKAKKIQTEETEIAKDDSLKEPLTGANIPSDRELEEFVQMLENADLQDEYSSPLPRRLHTRPARSEPDPLNFWPAEYDITPFNIIEKSSSLFDYQSSYNEIQKVMIKPFEREDEGDGYVYVFEVEGNKGLVKIGFTSRSLKLRQREWTFDCNREPKVLYPSATDAINIPHARRVEALCHAELNHRRLRIFCSACLKQHIEWFEISPTEAIETIEKWTRWMLKQPYKSIELRSKVKWALKEEERQRLRDINSFMKEISQDTSEIVAPVVVADTTVELVGDPDAQTQKTRVSSNTTTGLSSASAFHDWYVDIVGEEPGEGDLEELLSAIYGSDTDDE